MTTTLWRSAFVAVVLAASAAGAAGPSPVGRWRTIDDKTGAQTSVVEITPVGDGFVGRVIRIMPQPGDPADPVCVKCSGPEKNQHILGMTILRGFTRHGDKWDGGAILDPRSGAVYKSEMHVDDGGRKLRVRGYIGVSLLGRTETWLRDD